MSMENIIKYSQRFNLFWKDDKFPEDKRIVATEQEMDRWIAHHYNLTLENIPMIKPISMPKYIFDRLRKYNFHKIKGNAESKKKTSAKIGSAKKKEK